MKYIILLVTAILWSQSEVASADDIFMYQGPWQRVSGGAGVTESISGAATLHNPANLVRHGSHSYGDVGLTQLSYSFAARGRNEETGSLKMNVPLVSLGGSWRVSRKFALGLSVIPLGAKGSKNKTSDFPVKIGGSVFKGDIILEQSSYKAAVGVSYRFNKRLLLGLSAILHNNATATEVMDENPDQPLFSINESSQYVTPLLGVSGRHKRITWGATYSPATAKPYKIGFQERDNDLFEGEGQTYQAAVVGLGVKYRAGKLMQPYMQYKFERWAPGQDESTTPITLITEGEKGIDYRNAHGIVIGNKFKIGRQSIYVSAGKFDPNKSTGVVDEKGKLAYEGVKLRDFEGMSRMQLTTGLTSRLYGKRINSYLTMMKASADAPTGTPSEGLYELTMGMLGTGMIF